MTEWEIKGREFGNCNCSYGGHCHGLAVFDIERGHHGTTRLEGLGSCGIFRWPRPIHEGKGEGVHIVDSRATPAQRAALLRIPLNVVTPAHMSRVASVADNPSGTRASDVTGAIMYSP